MSGEELPVYAAGSQVNSANSAISEAKFGIRRALRVGIRVFVSSIPNAPRCSFRETHLAEKIPGIQEVF